MPPVQPLSETELAELDPKIRRTVKWLRSQGYDTCDSGDGSKAGTMECAMSVPNVFMDVEKPIDVISEADRLHALLLPLLGEPEVSEENGPSWMVQTNYSPFDGIALIELYGVSDDMLPADLG